MNSPDDLAPGGIDEQLADTISDREPHLPISYLEKVGLGDRLDDLNTLVRLSTSVGLERRIPQEWARSVCG